MFLIFCGAVTYTGGGDGFWFLLIAFWTIIFK